MRFRGWLVGLAIAAGCAGRARPVAPRLAGLAPSARHVARPAIARLAVAPRPTPAGPMRPHPRAADRDRSAAPTGLGDGAVVRALSGAEPSYLRCFRRAQRLDPGLVHATVTVEARIAPSGQIDLAQATAPTAAFGACVVAVTRALRFAPPAAPVRIVLPLRFAAPT